VSSFGERGLRARFVSQAAMAQATGPSGMRTFTAVWIGQLISLVGTGMTGFALVIYIWQLTGQATALALGAFFRFAPTVLVSPIAGALVDRWNRRKIIVLADSGAGILTSVLLLLYVTDDLQIWHIYLAGAFTGAFESFHFPAFSAAITVMLKKEHYARASGMMSFAEAASGIFAPIFAGVLLIIIGIGGVMTIDVFTFVVAVTAVLLMRIPQPAVTESGQAGRGSILKESIYGFRYIFQRRSLLGLQMVFFGVNFTATFSGVVLAPMILARTNDNTALLGTVQSAFGVGGVAGALVLSTWGGPKRKVHGILLGMVLASILGEVTMGIGRDVFLWATAAFLGSFFIPIINGSNQAIWQAKVAPDVQGRVFAARRLIAQITIPAAMIIAGLLADGYFEPALRSGGALSDELGFLVGVGPGSGMALMFIISGIIGALIGIGGYAFHAVRDAEEILPDHSREIQQLVEA